MNETISERFSEFCTSVFGPLLKPVFQPLDSVLVNIYMPWAKIAALGMFIGTMIWVYSLKKEYVNIDAPNRNWWNDLRLWTVVSMLPHVIVYIYF